ncbi:MAG: enoyl-CoA hydratase/isomerase family protein [Hyphomicrobiaceae bacterium]|nr:enoyl-CoA hydratase/isomerase family protein [Hyphomicrobiaceae bacterium]
MSGNAEQLVEVDRPAAGVARLTLNRPEKRNALSRALIGQLAGALADMERDRTVACVVLTGKGKAFSAGADLGEFRDAGADAYLDPKRLSDWQMIDRFAKPLIAAINGFAIGGGLELALLCDILVAADTAVFGTPEINVASFPGDGGTQRLPRIVGRSFAMQMILTGTLVDAAEALRRGLVSEVVPLPALDARSLELAVQISAKSAAITPHAKRAVRLAAELPLAVGLMEERRLVAAAFGARDRAEGLAAFFEKRPPQYSGE